ncbi:hypothetical protein K9L27_00605 [Candidatus Gracilibacteria bacterium]|nr:hypothetical protein [Candidatus Gracilibacteria bacterium]
MKVVLLTTNHYVASSIATRAFLQNTLRKKYSVEVVGIVAVSIVSWNKSSWNRMMRFLKQSGLKFFLKSVATDVFQRIKIRIAKYCIPDKSRKLFEIEELAQQNKIPFLTEKDANSEEVRKFICSKKPDYLVSCLFLHILEKSILDIPQKGSINFHPALFQDHRGTSSGFWTLFRNKRVSGATVHFMNEKLDDGKVVLQRNFFIHPSDTIHSVNQKSAQLGGNLLLKALIKLEKKKIKAQRLQKIARIFTIPTKKEAEAFEKKGKKIIHWEDLFRI